MIVYFLVLIIWIILLSTITYIFYLKTKINLLKLGLYLNNEVLKAKDFCIEQLEFNNKSLIKILKAEN